MNESTFTTRVMKDLNAHKGTHFVKIHGNRFSMGIPDLLGSISSSVGFVYGGMFAVESKVIDIPKRETTMMNFTKDLTPVQRSQMIKFHEAGAKVYLMVLCRPLNTIVYLDYTEWAGEYKMTQRQFHGMPKVGGHPHPYFPTQYNPTRKARQR